MDESAFAVAMEDVAGRCYAEVVKSEKDRVMVLLIDKVYFNLARYEEFINFRKNYDPTNFNPTDSPFNNSLQ